MLSERRQTAKKLAKSIFKALLMMAMLYVFLVSIQTLSGGFKLLGEDFANGLLRTTDNPFIGLLIGILATSIIQSSSTTTSMVVSLVGAQTVGALTIGNAIPIVMGANIGTTITNTLVSLGHIKRKDEFRRAMGAAMVHDIFNILCVIVFLSLELAIRHVAGMGFLEYSAGWLAQSFAKVGGLDLVSPLKIIIDPVANTFKHFVASIIGVDFWSGIAIIAISLAALFFALINMVKIVRSATLSKFEVLFDKYVGRFPIMALFLGIAVTAIIQSSSVTTSILVPMVGAGILTVRQIYPVTLGANIGTTVTAVLAALTLAAGNADDPKAIACLTIAFVHLLFNISGLIVFYVPPKLRDLPIWISEKLAGHFAQHRTYAIIYIISLFFVIPGLLIFVHEML